jgi:uncharacterized membrane protein YdcZ (DUF606 family)
MDAENPSVLRLPFRDGFWKGTVSMAVCCPFCNGDRRFVNPAAFFILHWLGGKRGRIVEFCHAWIKSKLGLRQFHVRGLAKAQMEMLWTCLTFNLQHWIRLGKLRATPAFT